MPCVYYNDISCWSITDTCVVSALLRMIRLVLTLKLNVSKNTQKRMKLGMATVDYSGSAKGVSWY